MSRYLPILFLLGAWTVAYNQTNEDSLVVMQLEELMNMQISSVSRFEESASQSPAIVTIINHEMIRERGYRTIYDVLKNIPGFWPIQDVNDRLMGVRGVHASTGQKFLLLINGKKLTENLWNLTDIDYNISLENVKRIEINRGPGSAVYGRAALTAVINVVTFSGKEIDGIQLDFSLGNYGYKKAGFSFGSQDENGSEIEVYGHLVSIAGQEFDIPADKDGAANRVNGKEIVDNFKVPTGGMGARFHNEVWDVNCFAQTRVYQQPRGAGAQLTWQEIASNTNFSNAYKNQLLGEEHKYIVFDAQRNFKIRKVKNSISAGYTYTRLRLRENPKPFRDLSFPASWTQEDSLNYSLGEMFEFDIQSHRYGVEYFGSYSLKKMFSAVWGLEAYQTSTISDKFSSNYNSYVDTTTSQLVKEPIPGGYMRELQGGTFDKSRNEQLYSGFMEFKLRLTDGLRLNVGGRYDVHVKGEDFRQSEESARYPDANAEQKRLEINKTSAQFSPRVALIAMPFNNDLLIGKFIYNKSFIAPGYFYRYADPSTSYAGGPWLKSETLNNYMLSLESITGSISAKAVGYVNVNKNLLTRDVSLTPARYTSLGKLAMQGFELDIMYMLSSMYLYANYAYMVGNERWSDPSSYKTWVMENTSIKNFPKHSGNFGLSYFLLNRQLTLTINNRWGGEILSPIGAGLYIGTIEELPFNLTSDFIIRIKPKRIDRLDLNVSVYNLLDTEVRYGGTVRIPYNQAGRWMNFSLVKTF